MKRNPFGALLDKTTPSEGLLLLILSVIIGGALIAGPIIAWFARKAKGHGVPEVMQDLLCEAAEFVRVLQLQRLLPLPYV